MKQLENIGRRQALRLFGTAAALCPICLSGAAGEAAKGAAPAHGAGGPVHWDYSGEGGPEHWGEIAPENRVCGLGTEQTPIDLKSALRAELPPVTPDFREMPLKILNNGHTIQVNCAPGSSTVIAGQRYELLQFHFHHPSEHLLEGERQSLELHFVHKSAAGALAVLGVFIRRGMTNSALAPIFDAMPASEGPEKSLGTTIRPAGLLPMDRRYFRYQGSLTTPPCFEGLTWTVFKQPIEASDAQIRQFAALFSNNARPVLPLHGRYLLESS